ncbi:PACE efflux transporter [Maribius pontilimi]|uniref:PACE efflux transporter n=1 Tax=Palleronia pontilimi TaxID=1964209 RepID=A0A934IJX5_9RHOB|nr:PACE efflux transporter [Palleronia pontilimi]MBJ3764293.1 PACE efflux transporter [Palleronia pontilimi]
MLRSWKERACQTGCFEVIGIALVAPVYTAIFGASLGHGVQVIALLSVVIVLWSPLHNTLFDLADWRMTGRTACQRPKSLRLVHAMSHEASAVLLTCPILVWFGHGLAEALAVNLGLTIAYTAYGYVFHLVYDRLRPVRLDPAPRGNGVVLPGAYLKLPLVL